MSDGFTKTDVYGLFKPEQGSNQWGHFIAVDMDIIDRLLAVHKDRIAVLEARTGQLMRRVAALEARLDPPAADDE